jgi:ABC-type dipeptide/oligopeptide/nickel transport system ATPase component
MDNPLLEVDLSVRYPSSGAGVHDVRFQVGRGEIVGLAGESGSGKSTVALAVMGLLARRGGIPSGRIAFKGRELLGCPPAELRSMRGRELSLLLQNPLSALNPNLRLRKQFYEAWRAHSTQKDGWIARASETLTAVGLPAGDAFFNHRPRELSTGMAQRVLLALSLLHSPALLIADEPTSALDVITQSEVLSLFRGLNHSYGLSMLLISHDILALVSICDRIAIMKEGTIVETAAASELLTNPKHPYTKRIVEALPLAVLRCVG